MAKNTRSEPADATTVRMRLSELNTEDKLRDEVLPWLNDEDRLVYYKIEQLRGDEHSIIFADRSIEDFDFHFSNAITAFEFKLRYG